MRQLAYQVCYTRYHVSFYLRLIGSVLKHCKVPKYYDQDYGLMRICKVQFWSLLFLFSTSKFSPKNSLKYWSYLINLAAVYSLRLEASAFSCFQSNTAQLNKVHKKAFYQVNKLDQDSFWSFVRIIKITQRSILCY